MLDRMRDSRSEPDGVAVHVRPSIIRWEEPLVILVLLLVGAHPSTRPSSPVTFCIREIVSETIWTLKTRGDRSYHFRRNRPGSTGTAQKIALREAQRSPNRQIDPAFMWAVLELQREEVV
jgi:hypothetical protein